MKHIPPYKNSIPLYTVLFYPYLHCSFWPQVSNNDVEISILPYIALFTCVYVNNAMQGRIEKSIPPYAVLFLSLLALRFLI